MKHALVYVLWMSLVGVSFLPLFLKIDPTQVQAGMIVIVAFYMIMFRFLPQLIQKSERLTLDFDLAIITVLIILFINTMGSIESEFFFLYYFLALGAALLLGVGTSISITFSLLVCYGLVFARLDSSLIMSSLIRLLFLLITIPFAVFFGSSYLKRQEYLKKIQILIVEKKNFSNILEMMQNNIMAWSTFQVKEPLTDIKIYLHSVTSNVESMNRLEEIDRQYLQHAYDRNLYALDKLKDLEQKVYLDATVHPAGVTVHPPTAAATND